MPLFRRADLHHRALPGPAQIPLIEIPPRPEPRRPVLEAPRVAVVAPRWSRDDTPRDIRLSSVERKHRRICPDRGVVEGPFSETHKRLSGSDAAVPAVYRWHPSGATDSTRDPDCISWHEVYLSWRWAMTRLCSGATERPNRTAGSQE